MITQGLNSYEMEAKKYETLPKACSSLSSSLMVCLSSWPAESSRLPQLWALRGWGLLDWLTLARMLRLLLLLFEFGFMETKVTLRRECPDLFRLLWFDLLPCELPLVNWTNGVLPFCEWPFESLGRFPLLPLRSFFLPLLQLCPATSVLEHPVHPAMLAELDWDCGAGDLPLRLGDLPVAPVFTSFNSLFPWWRLLVMWFVMWLRTTALCRLGGSGVSMGVFAQSRLVMTV